MTYNFVNININHHLSDVSSLRPNIKIGEQIKQAMTSMRLTSLYLKIILMIAFDRKESVSFCPDISARVFLHDAWIEDIHNMPNTKLRWIYLMTRPIDAYYLSKRPLIRVIKHLTMDKGVAVNCKKEDANYP